MFEDITKPPKPLPQPRLKHVQEGLSLLPPLSRRRKGPGLIVLVPDYNVEDQLAVKDGVPSQLLKWSEEGFAVVEIQANTLASNQDCLNVAITCLNECAECENVEKLGIVAYSAELWNLVAPRLIEQPKIVGAVVYGSQDTASTVAEVSLPVLRHLAGSSTGPPTRKPYLTTYAYPTAKSPQFATPFTDDFNYSLESVSHSRILSFLKPLIGGPFFDLEFIWEEHTYYEFADRLVDHTMSTMVQEPYVNHIPTITGGIGRTELTAFYKDHFIFNNSADTELELISRTIGIDRVVDEFIFKMTHDLEVDWLIPGIPPTGVKLEIPFTAVVNFRGDRLYHEHISWDQGTVLRQLGLLPEYLPYPYPMPNGATPKSGFQFEYRVPVAGAEGARKMKDKDSVPSNEMFSCKVRETRIQGN